jgi:hypothetical protein
VRVTDKALENVNESFRGKVGTVVQVYSLRQPLPVLILFEGLEGHRSFEEFELERVE